MNKAALNGGDVLETALTLLNGPRQEQYGAPAESLRRIAALWSAYLGVDVSGKDVALLMALLKICREGYRHKPDNLIDAAGYIALAGDLEGGLCL
jgi:hypothetical protein